MLDKTKTGLIIKLIFPLMLTCVSAYVQSAKATPSIDFSFDQEGQLPKPNPVPTGVMTGTLQLAPKSADQHTQPSIFEKNCGKTSEGYACPQCEDDLNSKFNQLMGSYLESPASGDKRWADQYKNDGYRIKPGKTAEDFIDDSIKLMREANPEGGGKLNMIPMGRSDSLHDTSPNNPRVLLKSPNGELWVTYNTNPKSYAYQKVEMMRWDGKAGKYQFQELDFSNGKGGHHANYSGKVCATCHKEDSRPIWDTYRAWPGVMHPRDDMVEAEDPNKGGKIDAAGRDYMRFLERIAAAKENPSNGDRRLASLDIPSTFSGTPREQISQIKDKVEKTGWYRVPVFPDAPEVKNYDEKTAPKAGPSHLTFDQILGQQMCHVATQLQSSKPAFDKLKYAITGVIKCMSLSHGEKDLMHKFLPPNFSSQLDLYFQNPLHRTMPQGGSEPSPAVDEPLSGGAREGKLAMYDPIQKNTLRWIEAEAQNKNDTEKEYLTEVLKNVEHASSVDATNQARYIAEQKKMESIYPYNAIKDPGGVRGVAEASPGTVANLRYLLEPLGYPVDGWSTSRGNGAAGGKSFSFSDQFISFLGKQHVFDEVYNSVPGNSQNERCQELMKRSNEALNNQYFYLKADVDKLHLSGSSNPDETPSTRANGFVK